MNLRRLLALLPALCVLAALLPAAAQISPTEPDPLSRIRAAASAQACSATGESLCAEASPKIIANALGPSPLEENLRRLTDEIGGRMTGSPQMARAVDWAVRAFHDAGVDVHTESYTLPLSWSEGATRLDVLSPAGIPVRLVSVGWSPPTPAGGIEASVVFAGEGTEEDFARLGERGRGAILLVHSEVLRTWSDLFDEYERAPGIIDRAVKAQAAGILWMSTRERLLLYRHQNTISGQLDRLPQAIVAREDALRLERFLEEGQAVRVRWDMPNHVGPAIEQQNVVGEIRGREKPDEAVILGAHLDSWELGTGALDNGCNAAMVIEAARDIRATGLVPRRTIRFVLFSGEEQGMLGSWAYVRAHRDEMDRIRGVVIFDEGIGRVTGFSLGGRHDIESGVREASKPLEGWGVSENTYDAPLGTDNFDFLLEGVPNLIANQVEANYIPNYHATSDTFDKVDIRELKLHAAIAGVTVFGIAESVAPLGTRLSRADLETLLKQTGLDEQMKAAGIWPLWESGQRGRQP
jgi:hypothetical protein